MWLNQDGKLANQILMQQEELPGPTWLKNTMAIAEEIGIPEEMGLEQIKEYKEDEWRKIVKNRVLSLEYEEYQEWAAESKKCKHMKMGEIKIKEYLKRINPNHARAIMNIRLGMIEVKENFHGMFEDTTCRNCKDQVESSEHFIRCIAEDGEKEELQNFEQIWSLENLELLKSVASTVYKILKNNKYFVYSGSTIVYSSTSVSDQHQ